MWKDGTSRFPPSSCPWDSTLLAMRSCLDSFLLAWFIWPGLAFSLCFQTFLTPPGVCLLWIPIGASQGTESPNHTKPTQSALLPRGPEGSSARAVVDPSRERPADARPGSSSHHLTRCRESREEPPSDRQTEVPEPSGETRPSAGHCCSPNSLSLWAPPGEASQPLDAHPKTQLTLGFHTDQLQHGTQAREQKPTRPGHRWGGGLKKHCQIHIASRQPAPDKGTPSRMPREVQTPTSSTGLLSPVPMAILRTPFHDNPWAGCAKEGALPPAGRGRPFVQPRWTTGSRASPKQPWNHRQTQRYPSRP